MGDKSGPTDAQRDYVRSKVREALASDPDANGADVLAAVHAAGISMAKQTFYSRYWKPVREELGIPRSLGRRPGARNRPRKRPAPATRTEPADASPDPANSNGVPVTVERDGQLVEGWIPCPTTEVEVHAEGLAPDRLRLVPMGDGRLRVLVDVEAPERLAYRVATAVGLVLSEEGDAA